MNAETPHVLVLEDENRAVHRTKMTTALARIDYERIVGGVTHGQSLARQEGHTLDVIRLRYLRLSAVARNRRGVSESRPPNMSRNGTSRSSARFHHQGEQEAHFSPHDLLIQ